MIADAAQAIVLATEEVENVGNLHVGQQNALPVTGDTQGSGSLPLRNRETGTPIVARIRADSLDILQRAQVGLAGCVEPPGTREGETRIVRGSAEDDHWFHIDAGQQAAKGARRKFLRELPGKIIGATGTLVRTVVKKIIPPWVLWCAGIGGLGYVLMLAYGKYLDIDRKRARRAYDELDDAVENALAEEQRHALKLGKAGLREHTRRDAERKNGA
jgi:hypothetical protein